MKLNKRIILIILIILLIMIILSTTNTVHAALQSNGGTATKGYIENWMKNIRKMESIGGGFGLSETIKSDLSPNEDSNNIDIHMQKNTEYGAMAILSASSYGNPNEITSGGTTTGNETGIVIPLNGEHVASAVRAFIGSEVYGNALGKYKNTYNDTYSAKIGDAISETAGWHR